MLSLTGVKFAGNGSSVNMFTTPLKLYHSTYATVPVCLPRPLSLFHGLGSTFRVSPLRDCESCQVSYSAPYRSCSSFSVRPKTRLIRPRLPHGPIPVQSSSPIPSLLLGLPFLNSRVQDTLDRTSRSKILSSDSSL